MTLRERTLVASTRPDGKIFVLHKGDKLRAWIFPDYKILLDAICKSCGDRFPGFHPVLNMVFIVLEGKQLRRFFRIARTYEVN